GHQSGVTGGTTYPWPLRQWADVRVDPNPDSPQIISIVQDAQAHHRWHPVGDGYQPQAGDWVLFDGHVEVVTSYSHGALRTIGGDSAPNLSVNAHTFTGSLAAQGVNGFVNNGQLLSTVSQQGGSATGATATAGGSAQAETAGFLGQGQAGAGAGDGAAPARAGAHGGSQTPQGSNARQGSKARQGSQARQGANARQGSKARQGSQARPGSRASGSAGTAVIPGLQAPASDAHRS